MLFCDPAGELVQETDALKQGRDGKGIGISFFPKERNSKQRAGLNVINLSLTLEGEVSPLVLEQGHKHDSGSFRP